MSQQEKHRTSFSVCRCSLSPVGKARRGEDEVCVKVLEDLFVSWFELVLLV